MSFDRIQYRVTLECRVFHPFDCQTDPDPILALIHEINCTFTGFEFDAPIFAHKVLSPAWRVRELRPLARNWAKVLTEVQCGEISNLVYGSMQDEETLGINIDFYMDGEPWRNALEAKDSPDKSVGIGVSDSLLRSSRVEMATCVNLMRRSWESLNGVYGFADMFVSSVRYTGAKPEACRAFRAKENSSFVISPPGDIAKEVPDAYWLNFLNARHVAHLGGMDRLIDNVKRSLPRASIEPLGSGGVVIRLSPWPIYEDTETWEVEHEELAKILAPILYQPVTTARTPGVSSKN